MGRSHALIGHGQPEPPTLRCRLVMNRPGPVRRRSACRRHACVQHRGQRTGDAAVAFVTTPGVAVLCQYLKAHPPGPARLVASVRFRTNLTELAHLEEDYPGTVFLHTGFQTPIAGPVPGVHGACRRPSSDYNGGKGAHR